MLIFKKYKGNVYTGYTQYQTERVWNDYLPDEWKTAAAGTTTIGGGVVFLPGDIAGLRQKLLLLLGEYHAGNTTTYNELVAVLDELRKQNAISEQKYESILAQIL